MGRISYQIPVTALGLVSLRIAGLAISAPMLNHHAIPRRIRGAFVIVLSFFFINNLKTVPVIDSPVILALACTSEFIIGFAMGTVINMIVAAVSSAGQLMAMEMGFAFASMADPSTGEQSTVIQTFFSMFLVLVFVLLDGHLQLIKLVALSYEKAPIASAFSSPSAWKTIAGMGSILFETAFRLALPVTGAILLTQVAIALAAKMAPRLNVFILGFAIMILIGLVMLPAILPSVTSLFKIMMDRAFETAINLEVFRYAP